VFRHPLADFVTLGNIAERDAVYSHP